MARNPIQFKPGLSLSAVLEQYLPEAQCRAARYRNRSPSRFPAGFKYLFNRRHDLRHHPSVFPGGGNNAPNAVPRLLELAESYK